jgi:hypothetical protein
MIALYNKAKGFGLWTRKTTYLFFCENCIGGALKKYCGADVGRRRSREKLVTGKCLVWWGRGAVTKEI